MSANLSELQARDAVRRMQGLRQRLNTFAAHARMLRSLSQAKAGVDDRMLLQEANHLSQELTVAFQQYQTAQSRVGSIGRSLPVSGGSPVSPWKFELRAGSQQFLQALKGAETEIAALQKTTMAGLNDPLRTPALPSDPGLDNIADIVLGFADMLSKWVDRRRAG